MKCLRITKNYAKGKDYYETESEIIDSHSIFEDSKYLAIIKNIRNAGKNLNDIRNDFFPLKLYRYISPNKHLGDNLSGSVFLQSPKNYNDILEVPVDKEALSSYLHRHQFYNPSYYDIRDMIVTACFSERFDNNAMWYHYAQNHSGVCIEYDTSSLYKIGDIRIIADGTAWGKIELNEGITHLLSLFPVIYSDQRYFPHELGNYTNLYIDNYLSPSAEHSKEVDLLLEIVPSFISKTPEWENEKEWRLLYSGDRFNRNPLFVLKDNCINILPCISKVIIGYHANKEIREEVLKIANQRNYSVSEMIKDNEQNRLTEKRVFTAKPIRPIGQAQIDADRDLFLKIQCLIVEILGVSEEQVVNNAKIIDDLSADSLDVVNVVMSIEDEFNIIIEYEDMTELKTINDIFCYVNREIWR